MNCKQLSLFDDGGDNFDDLPQEPLDLLLESEEEKATPKNELLTIRLMKEAIKKSHGNQGDRLLESFADNVLPKLIQNLIGSTAKGGQFTENMRRLGKNVERSKQDQSFISHLLNGLFPTYRIIKKLLTETPETNGVKRNCGAAEIALFVAAYILHDFDKFSDYSIWLSANDAEGKFQNRNWQEDPPHKQDAPNFGRDYVALKIQEFGLDLFLGENWQSQLDDILRLSFNAGDKWDADLGLESRGLQPKLDGRVFLTLANLVKLSDRFASVVKYPQDIEQGGLPDLIGTLSNHQLKFSYHSLSDNRGVLTNLINNAVMDAHPKEFYTDLLYLPNGVIYLAKADAPAINYDELPQRVINTIRSLCADKLQEKATGFNRDGKGFKFADYYWLFFNLSDLMKVSIKAAIRLISSSKNSSAKKRSDSLAKFQKAGELPASLNLKFSEDYRIDRLAEFGDILCRGIWDKWCEVFETSQKKIAKAKRTKAPELELTQKLADFLDLAVEIPAITAIQSLKKTGGVPLDWYYLAAKYLQQNKGLDEAQLNDKMAEMVDYAAGLIQPLIQELTIPDGWQDLRTYVRQVVALPAGAVVPPTPQSFLVELTRYHAAKVTERGRENVCAMCSSSYTVTEQMEAATLFSPQVYSNRQILFNAQAAKRQICSICSIEIMLRQILMNQTNATGRDFEDRKYRYLYLYPAYFFTPETNKFLQKAYMGIKRTRFDAELRKHFITEQQIANFGIGNYLQVDSLLIDENLETENDSTFKLNYPEDKPLTFFFIALPPGKDATDTESWVMPAWLTLALPLIMDVKVVSSESPVPPFISGADFEKTAVLDGEHQAIRALIKQDDYRLDGILPPAKKRKFSPLNALTAAYAIHLEVNRKKDGNPDWGKLSDLARDLETSPLYVFHYLNKWLRKQDKIEHIPLVKIRLYLDFYYYFEPQGETVNKLRKMTHMYRNFYRAKRQFAKANAILKPIDEAADVILKFDKSLANDTESLIDVVAARLSKLMNNVRRKAAEGKPTFAFVDGKWKPALTSEEERQAVYDFASFFVKEIFEESFKGDRARLAGTQLNLIRDTCEFLYRLADDEERKNRPQDEPDDISDTEA